MLWISWQLWQDTFIDWSARKKNLTFNKGQPDKKRSDISIIRLHYTKIYLLTKRVRQMIFSLSFFFSPDIKYKKYLAIQNIEDYPIFSFLRVQNYLQKNICKLVSSTSEAILRDCTRTKIPNHCTAPSTEDKICCDYGSSSWLLHAEGPPFNCCSKGCKKELVMK